MMKILLIPILFLTACDDSTAISPLPSDASRHEFEKGEIVEFVLTKQRAIIITRYYCPIRKTHDCMYEVRVEDIWKNADGSLSNRLETIDYVKEFELRKVQ